MTMKRKGGEPPQNAVQNEVLFEFQRVGKIMRVVAIDPDTATEVIMVADPRHGMDTIKRLAARKLAYVLAKKRAKAEKNGDKPGRLNKLI